MRMMARFTIPVESGNELIRSGKLNQSFERLMEDLKPEAAYFFPDSTGVGQVRFSSIWPKTARSLPSLRASPSVSALR